VSEFVHRPGVLGAMLVEDVGVTVSVADWR